jgi:hypothetical protein
VFDTPSTLPGAEEGVTYSTTVVAEGGTGILTYSPLELLPTGLTLAPGGTLSGTPGSGTAGSYPLKIKVTDSTGVSLSAIFSLGITGSGPPPPPPPPPPPLVFVTASPLPPVAVGGAYRVSIVAAGGTGALTYTALQVLPQGLVLTSDGTLSGNPAAGTAGGYSLRLEVTDSTGVSLSATFALTISPATPPPPPPPLKFVTTTIPPAYEETPYSTIMVATGGTGTLSWSVAGSGALPSGLTLAPDGTLSGTPGPGTGGSPGTGGTQYQFNLKVTDSTGVSITATFGMSVITGPPPAAWVKQPSGTQPGWGGLVFSPGSPADAATGITSISATFTIPSLTGSSNSLLSVWVGINNVQQHGLYLSYDTTRPGNCHASPWTWYLPAAEIWDESAYPYRAGDSVTLTLSYDANWWYVNQTNNTRGWSMSEKKSMQAANIGGLTGSGQWPFPAQQAEVIIEKEGTNNLPEYGHIQFSNISMNLTSGNYSKINTVNGSTTDQTPSDFTGSSFVMTWKAAH